MTEAGIAYQRDLEVLVGSGKVSSNNAEEILGILSINPVLFILSFGENMFALSHM
jgi:hypothetical protein